MDEDEDDESVVDSDRDTDMNMVEDEDDNSVTVVDWAGESDMVEDGDEYSGTIENEDETTHPVVVKYIKGRFGGGFTITSTFDKTFLTNHCIDIKVYVDGQLVDSYIP